MIYCNFNPGLLVLKELEPHQLDEAKQILDALAIHKKHIINYKAQIPVTAIYLSHILESLAQLKIQKPPIEQPLKALLMELLGRTVTPPLPPALIKDAEITPNIIPEWINEETKSLWMDCLVSALFQKASEEGLTKAQANHVIATLSGISKIPCAKIQSQDLSQIIEGPTEFTLSILATNIEWLAYMSMLEPWPTGIDSSLIELYGYYNLDVPIDLVSEHRKVIFETPCLHDISREDDVKIRSALIEVISCRAYNRLKPEHDDHKHSTKPGIRRLYVKKMTPPVRLHYYFQDDNIVFCMYSNGNHDKGL